MIVAILIASLLNSVFAAGPVEDLIGTVVLRKILLSDSRYFTLSTDDQERLLSKSVHQAKDDLGTLTISRDAELEILKDVRSLIHEIRGEMLKLELVPEDLALLRDDRGFQRELLLECERALETTRPLESSQKAHLLQILDHLTASATSVKGAADVTSPMDLEAIEGLRKSYESDGQLQELIWFYRRMDLTEKASNLELRLAEELSSGAIESKARSPIGENRPLFLRLKNRLMAVFKTKAPQEEVDTYKLDRLLGLDIVPMTVKRVVDGESGSVQAYIQNSQTASGTQIPWGVFVSRRVQFLTYFLSLSKSSVARTRGRIRVVPLH